MPRRGQTKMQPGDRFGELTLTRFLGCYSGASRWEASCSCGGKTQVRSPNLSPKRGKRGTTSCGDRTKHPRPNTRHGLSLTPEYRAWKGMLRRCRSKIPQVAIYYRDRGTVVCKEWEESFIAFLRHIGPMPDGHRIGVDRYPNPSGNYEPGNVRWAGPALQNSNKRPRRWKVRPRTETAARCA